MDLKVEGRITAYYERAPSASNLADAPSRGRLCARLPGWPAPVVSDLVALAAEGDQTVPRSDSPGCNTQARCPAPCCPAP